MSGCKQTCNEEQKERPQNLVNDGNEKEESKPGKRSVKQMAAFCDRLESFTNKIKSLDEVKDIYSHAQHIQDRLNKEVKELDFILKETKATLVNINNIKYQRHNVKKEFERAKKVYTGSKSQEVQEKELIVAIYDKDLLRKWHVAKKSTTPHILDTFICNLQGKKLALDHVYQLATEKLQLLKLNETNESREENSTLTLALPAPEFSLNID